VGQSAFADERGVEESGGEPRADIPSTVEGIIEVQSRNTATGQIGKPEKGKAGKKVKLQESQKISFSRDYGNFQQGRSSP